MRYIAFSAWSAALAVRARPGEQAGVLGGFELAYPAVLAHAQLAHQAPGGDLSEAGERLEQATYPHLADDLVVRRENGVQGHASVPERQQQLADTGTRRPDLRMTTTPLYPAGTDDGCTLGARALLPALRDHGRPRAPQAKETT